MCGGWRIGAAGDVGGGATLKMMRFCINVQFSFVLLQAPGFGDGETFTDKTFTGRWKFELDEMEVFAVSGYP